MKKILLTVFFMLYSMTAISCAAFGAENIEQTELPLISMEIEKTGTLKVFDAEITKTGIELKKINYGSAGHVSIPDLGIEVALNWTNKEDPYAQSIVDLWDSAVRYSDFPIIGDHSHQEFAPLPSAQIGMTMILSYPDGREEHYTCVGFGIGTNTGYDLIDQNGVDDDYFSYLTLYTCYNGWQHPFVSQWAAF